MNRIHSSHRSELWIIAALSLIIAVGAFLRFYQIGKLSFWLDEAAQFAYSGGNFSNLVTSIRGDPNMSLFHILCFLWIRIFPNASDGMLRALSAILSILSLPVLFQLGKTLTSDRSKSTIIGLIACSLTSLNAFNIEYAQEFRSYSLTFLLTSFSTLFFIRAIYETGTRKRPRFWYVIISAAAVYSHLFAGFLIAAQAVTLFILLITKKKHYLDLLSMLWSYLVITCLVIPIAILAYLRGPEQLSWITRPTLGNIKTFLLLMTGNQGKVLFAFYFIFGCIGLFFREKFGFPKDHITRWKFVVMASCLFLPVVFTLVFSFVVVPIFMPKYLLFVMPYLMVIVATGIESVVSSGWNNKSYRKYLVPIGITLLVLFGVLTTLSINSYFVNKQKSEWRTASQLLTARCSDSLRLYYAPYVDTSVLYYNPALFSQKKDWWISTVGMDLDSKKLASIFPRDYSQVCLVIAHSTNQEKQKSIQTAIRENFPKLSVYNFYEVEIDIFTK